MKYKYSVRCIGGTTMTFETDENIDFHTLSNTAIAFNDMYINMANIIYIQKQIITKGGIDNAPTVAINKDFYKTDKSNPINRSDLFQ